VLVIVVHAASFPYIPEDITSTEVMNWFASNVYSAFGYLGVPLFVMLTGALLLDPNRNDEPLGVYFKKRLNRIALPVIFWTVAYFLWSYFVHYTPFTLFNVSQGLLTGSYSHLWFMYLLMGLYVAAPFLRILVKHLDNRKFTLLIAVWFIGVVATPAIHVFTDFSYNPVTFFLMDWAGYFLLGIYLLQNKRSSRVLYAALLVGVLVTIFGDWLITATFGLSYNGYFHGYLSFNMIIAAAGLFLLLATIPASRAETRFRNVNRVVHWIGQNTLPIYLVDVMVLEALLLGLFGFNLPSANNLIVDIPVRAVATFVLSAAIVYPLMKIPYLKRLIG
jgi:surface polysaccharide O-acyltransferase-like enzyme